jgi:predicted metal-binding protein
MAARKKYERFVERALALGAAEAKVIDARTIATAAWVRMKCQFGCDGYASNLCCPPHTPTPERTREVIDCYEKAVLIHNTRARRGITAVVVKLEREIFLAGHYKAFGFGAGPCWDCKECDDRRCKHPEETRPSMESCGIDVFATARANGYPIEVVKNRKCDENYYGLVLVE